MRKRRLKSVDDVRRYLADLIHRTEAGQVDPSLAGRLGYLLNLCKGCIVDGDLEKRIEQLERVMEERNT